MYLKFQNLRIYNSNSHKKRIEEVTASINASLSYELTETELSFGARTAWRNTARYLKLD
jgi:nitric-oxide synthase, brain